MYLKGWVIPGTIGIATFGIGVGVGYIYAKKKCAKVDSNLVEIKEDIESQFVQLAFMFEERDQKVNSQIQQLSRVSKQQKENDQELPDNRTAPIKAESDNHPSNWTKAEIVPLVYNKDDNSLAVNIFQEEEDWDYDEEEKHRTPDKPYVIHVDEYMSNEGDHRQCSLMYYAGDNILCDEHDVPLYNPEKIVGKLDFGRGSRDPSIVFIRNELLDADYEVLFNPGSFQEEVLDQPPTNLRHAYGVPKFRLE